MFLNVALMSAEALAFSAAVVWLHRASPRWGLAPLLSVLAAWVAVLHTSQPLDLHVELGPLNLYHGSVVVIPVILAGLLLVYALDGTAAARVALFAVVGVTGVSFAMLALQGIHASLPGGRTAVAVSNHPALGPPTRVVLASLAAFLTGLLSSVVIYQYLLNRVGVRRRGWLVAPAVVAALCVDTVIFLLLVAAWDTQIFLGSMVGKAANGLLVSVVIGFYLASRDVSSKPRGALDLLLGSHGRQATELRRSEEQYRGLFEQSLDALVIADRAGRVVDANATAAALFGRPPAELVGVTVEELLAAAPGEAVERLSGAVRGGRATRLEFSLARAEGSAVAVELSVAPVPYAGQPHAVLIGRDVSERTRAHEERLQLLEQMQRTQKLESIGLLAGGVAHDFNNLLMGISGNAAVAAVSLPADSVAAPRLDEIQSAVERASELTRRLLAYSGRGRVEVGEVDLSRVVRETGRLLRPTVPVGVELVYDLEEPLPAWGDATQLQQVVMNLITNACDATRDRPHGTVRLIARKRRLSAADTGALYFADPLAFGDYASLIVIDDGVGMDEATRARIFDPFFTTKPSGHGLGMAAAMGIVRAHHGALRVESAPGRGTRIEVLIPVERSALGDAAAEEPRVAAGSWRGEGKVVVADDDAAVLSAARAMLETLGFETIAAANGEEAVAACHRNHGRMSAAVLDVRMPVLGGVEALREIRRRWPTLPVLMMSGEGAPSLQPGEAQGTSFLPKPFRLSALRAALGALIDRA